MNDRNAVGALYASPSVLLDRLGIRLVLLYRPRPRKWLRLSVEQLDDEIWRNGEALLFRWLDGGQASIIRLTHPLSCLLSERQYPAHALLTVWPDHLSDEKNFLVSLREEASGLVVYHPVKTLGHLLLLPSCEEDVVQPWAL